MFEQSLLHKVRILLLQQLCHYLNVSNLMNILLRLKKKRWENNETNKQINKLHQQQQQKKHNSITYMEYLAFVLPWSVLWEGIRIEAVAGAKSSMTRSVEVVYQQPSGYRFSGVLIPQGILYVLKAYKYSPWSGRPRALRCLMALISV